ncbi:MAG: protoporphyrinogen oxidase [Myxococcales bacterium]|nr:protoporphyrinogen oxidase [Myxococcales bacterium]
MTTRPRSIVVVGGGLSGLVAAYCIQRHAPEISVKVLEASRAPGGLIRTECRDGYVIERAADSILREPDDALRLSTELGLKAEMINTNTSFRGAYVLREGQLHRIPAEFRLLGPAQWWPFVVSPLLSLRGKLRACLEPWVPVRSDVSDESLEHFVVRRYGRELFEYLAQPLVSGIYSVDPAKLSMHATLKRYCELEAKYGSVSRGLRKGKARSSSNDAGVRYGLFFSYRLGLQTLIDALVDRLGSALSVNTEVTHLEPHLRGFRIQVKEGPSHLADAVLLALPAGGAASLLKPWAPKVAAGFAEIKYSDAVVVTLAFELRQIKHPLDAFGIVVPRVEQRPISAVTFSSVKYGERAPDGKVLLRVYFNDFDAHDAGTRTDAEFVDEAQAELRPLLGVEGSPVFVQVSRIKEAIPGYTLGHTERIARLREALGAYANLGVAGNYLTGVGIPHVIKNAEIEARRLIAPA